jgi:hypothetical protein
VARVAVNPKASATDWQFEANLPPNPSLDTIPTTGMNEEPPLNVDVIGGGDNPASRARSAVDQSI